MTGFMQESNFSWGKRVLKLNARRLVSDDALAELMLLWGEDITPTLEQLAQEGADAVARDLSP